VQTRARQLRRPLTPAEEVLWKRLRGEHSDGVTFRRQHPVGRFIVDFFCPTAKLVIEVDGDSHLAQIEYDAERTRWLAEQKRYRVIRFMNDEVMHDTDGVLDAIAAEARRPTPTR
jgi:very-short-patch-repair endonuclease